MTMRKINFLPANVNSLKNSFSLPSETGRDAALASALARKVVRGRAG